MSDNNLRVNEVLNAIRRIIRSIDIHSKKLDSTAGVTGPQLVVLKEIQHHRKITTTKLAENVCLSQSTATTILDKLEAKGLLVRTRDHLDKRRWHLELSPQGEAISSQLPFVLPELCMGVFTGLPVWHQNQIIATLQHVAEMMDHTE